MKYYYIRFTYHIPNTSLHKYGSATFCRDIDFEEPDFLIRICKDILEKKHTPEEIDSFFFDITAFNNIN